MSIKAKLFFVVSFMICTYYFVYPFYLHSIFKRDYINYLKKYKDIDIFINNDEKVNYFINGEIKKDSLHCQKGFRIIIQLNGQCGTCINTLKGWSTFSQEIKFPPENIIVYVHADNYAAFEYTMLKNKLNNFYMIYDKDSLFLKVNNLHMNSRDALLKVCIINNKNKIVAVGSPFSSSYIKEEYLNLLTKIDNNEE